jgi:hypothetical protein
VKPGSCEAPVRKGAEVFHVFSARPSALLDDVRRDTSCRLLANTDLEVSEVAFLVGL